MSSAFVREGDDQWLHEIAPTIEALQTYLTRENGGLSVTLKSTVFNGAGETLYFMSDGFSYCVRENKWVCLD